MSKTNVREARYNLLMDLKTNVEGLLYNCCGNVWSVYGGLDRVTNCVHAILNHELNYSCSQSIYDRAGELWKALRGLKWLDPVLSPSIDKISRDDSLEDQGRSWIEQSLLNFNLSMQIMTLVNNVHYLRQFYTEDAFILQAEYSSALITCIQAIELNRAAVLADINPYLLSRKSIEGRVTADTAQSSPIKHPLAPATSPVRTQSLRHTRLCSTSLPEDFFSELFTADDMGRLSATYDRLAPPMLVSAKPNKLAVSRVYAKPSTYRSSCEESARDALVQVLQKSGTTLDDLHEPSEKCEDLEESQDFVRQQHLLNKVTMWPSLDFSIEPHYNVDLASLLHGSRKHKRRKTRKVSSLNPDFNSVITKATSADILDRTLCDWDEAVESKHLEQSQTRDIPSAETEASAPNCNANETESQTELHIASSTPVPSSSTSVPPSSTAVPTSSTPGDNPDSGYSTLKSDTHKYKTKVDKSKSFQDATRRKSSHYRSMSDYGIASGSSHPSNQNNSNRSSSTSTLTDVPKLDSTRATPQASFFHQPQQGESLIGFLSSQDFHTAAELDRENAHFSICETLISAIEQMKFNQLLNPSVDDDVIEGDSDEEIQDLKQRIRIRRGERMRENARGFPEFADYRTDTTTTSSMSQYSIDEESFTSEDSRSSSEEIHDSCLDDADVSASESNLSNLKASGLSLSMASLYSDAELQKHNAQAERNHSTVTLGDKADQLGSVLPDGTLVFPQSTQVSAESVAISLLKLFSEKQLPKASDLEWLVSEQDAPQQLLPLPDSYPVSPDDNENSDLLTSGRRTRLRGNLEWAPPRPQIIFNIHPTPRRKVVMASQNHRCTGCGTKVLPAYMKRYQYCEYLGKYFCPCCHSNHVSYIPARILKKWDFNKFAVSHFARDVLTKIENEPLFSIEDLNPNLYRKAKSLAQIRDYRKQLTHLVAFLKTCRLGTRLLEIIEGEPSHWTIDPHVYTLRELVNVKKGLLLPRIRSLINESVTHVESCELCQAKGFICELCDDSKAIFPFQLERVKQCDLCRTCFHSTCFDPEKCPKCARIELRRQRANENIVED